MKNRLDVCAESPPVEFWYQGVMLVSSQLKGANMNLNEAKNTVAEVVKFHLQMTRSEYFGAFAPDSPAVSVNIAQLAIGMVDKLAGSWRDTTATEFGEFLTACDLDP